MGFFDKFKREAKSVSPPTTPPVIPPAKPTNRIEKLLRPKPNHSASDEVPRGRAKGQKVTPVELHNLRELLRQRYDLDLEIWTRRRVGLHDRRIVEDSMRRADAMLLRIRAIVDNMDRQEYFHNDVDFARFKQVKARIDEDGKRLWIQHPPWGEE